jgi:hypothetical protein
MTTAPLARAAKPDAWRWSGLMRMLEFVAYPASAGAAFLILSLGVITWLPALAAVAHALQAWRRDGTAHCFTGVFTAFRHYLRPMLARSAAATLVALLLLANTLFLVAQQHPVAFLFLAAQAGLGAVFVVYHLAYAVVAGCDPDGTPSVWTRAALAFGFGSARRGTALLGAAIAAPILSIVVPLGPLLLGPSLPVLVGLTIADLTAGLPRER